MIRPPRGRFITKMPPARLPTLRFFKGPWPYLWGTRGAARTRRGQEISRMTTTLSAPGIAREYSAIPASLVNVCFVLFVINASYFPAAYFSHWWIYDPDG